MSPPTIGNSPASQTLRPRLPFSIYALALVSMLNDIATDMVTPLIPILLATTMTAGPLILGIVEGVANAVAAALRLWAGRYSDVSGGRRKPLAIAGYLVSNIMRPLLALAGNWWQVVLIRALDRVGKGIRSAPRDALIVDLAPPSLRGRAFGIHSAFDNFGAVCGALIGAAVVSYFAWNLREIVLLSAIPGALAVILFALAVREPVKHLGAEVLRMRFRWQDVPPRMRGYLLTVTLFTFARTAELFVILRAHELGAGLAHSLLLWAAFNFIKVFANYGAGILADRFGRLALLRPGWLLYSLSMLGFCAVTDLRSLWMAALFFGFAISVTEGVERAVIGDHARPEERGTLFGWYYALLGVASIPAGLLIGWLWQAHGAGSAYAFSATVGLLAVLILHFRIAKQISTPA